MGIEAAKWLPVAECAVIKVIFASEDGSFYFMEDILIVSLSISV